MNKQVIYICTHCDRAFGEKDGIFSPFKLKDAFERMYLIPSKFECNECIRRNNEKKKRTEKGI